MNNIQNILKDNGDCCFGIVNGKITLTARIDEEELDKFYTNKVLSVFNELSNYSNELVDLNKVKGYMHFPKVCNEFYHLLPLEIDNVLKIIEIGVDELLETTKDSLDEKSFIDSIICFSIFLEFRKLYMNLEKFPKISFSSFQENDLKPFKVSIENEKRIAEA